jgi:hypothetical protein
MELSLKGATMDVGVAAATVLLQDHSRAEVVRALQAAMLAVQFHHPVSPYQDLHPVGVVKALTASRVGTESMSWERRRYSLMLEESFV